MPSVNDEMMGMGLAADYAAIASFNNKILQIVIHQDF